VNEDRIQRGLNVSGENDSFSVAVMFCCQNVGFSMSVMLRGQKIGFNIWLVCFLVKSQNVDTSCFAIVLVSACLTCVVVKMMIFCHPG
jgi:hypothetical protein